MRLNFLKTFYNRSSGILMLLLACIHFNARAELSFDSLVSSAKKTAEKAVDTVKKENLPIEAKPKSSNFKLSKYRLDLIDKDCTIGSEPVNSSCVEFNKEFYTLEQQYLEKPPYYGKLLRCFSEARDYGVAGNSISDAPDVYRSAPKDNPYVKECIRLIDKVTGNTKWRSDIDQQEKVNKYYVDLNEKVANGFPKKCDGVIASNTSNYRIQLTVSKRIKSKKVAFQEKDPEGIQMTIFCSGDIAYKYADGGSSYQQGQSFEETNANTEQDACMHRCGASRKTLECKMANGNITVDGCKQSCLPQCQ